jgi:hypothetical protein
MQLSDLRSSLIYLLDEDGVYRTDDILNASLNEGYVVLGTLSNAIEHTYERMLSADTHFIELDPNVLSPIAVYANEERLYPCRIASFDMLSETWMEDASDTTTHYAITNLYTPQPKLWVYPRSSISIMLRLTVAEIPDALVHDSEIPRLPPDHHYAIVVWALMWELLKERTNILANKAFQHAIDFVERVEALRTFVYRRTPNRDWMMPSLDHMAIRNKLHDITRKTTERSADAFTMKDMTT